MRFPKRLSIPAEVLRIAERLDGAGHEVWCVGGAVRDNLLGYTNKDFDIATSATPQQVQKLFRRTVPVGIEHGTVAVLGRRNEPHEVTTFRKDVKTDGRHAVVEFGVALDEDLARRDFTINAIAYHPLEHAWRDPFEGKTDLDRELLRAVGDPHQRFREDYLRILRLLRFAARFGFEIEKETWEAARENVEGLEHLSAERVNAEWFRGLEGARNPNDLVRLWETVRALEVWLPEVARETPGFRPGLAARLDRLPRDPVLLTAALSSNPEATLRRLKCSRAEIERGRRIGEFRGREPDPSDEVAVRRWLAEVGDAAEDLAAIAKAAVGGDQLEEAIERVRAAGAPLTLGELAVDGDDLIAAGVPRGPEVGRILRELLDRVLEHPALNRRAALLELVSTLSASRFPQGPGGKRERGSGGALAP